MVRGNWIISIKNMHCKNWVNGLEINFILNQNKIPEGRIVFIPRELFKNGSVKSILHIYRMWRNAIYIFQKLYFKKQATTYPGIYRGMFATLPKNRFGPHHPRSGASPIRPAAEYSLMYN
jgi:hypothetical protein